MSHITVDIEPARLAAALKAVREFVSRDQTRPEMGNILVEYINSSGHIRLTATDGHTLCSVEVICAVVDAVLMVRLDMDAVAGLLAGAKAFKGNDAARFELPDCGGPADFPRSYRNVIPPKLTGAEAGARVHGFDGRYLARIGHMQKALGARWARVQTGSSEGEPTRVDISGTHGDAVVVVLPVRL